RGRFARLGAEKAYEELKKFDPEYAEVVSPNDHYRILRALIVKETSGHKMSELRKSFAGQGLPYPVLKLGVSISKEELLPRVRARVREMLQAGWLDEVQRL